MSRDGRPFLYAAADMPRARERDSVLDLSKHSDPHIAGRELEPQRRVVAENVAARIAPNFRRVVHAELPSVAVRLPPAP